LEGKQCRQIGKNPGNRILEGERMNEIQKINTNGISLTQSRPMDENPAAVYLSQLNAKSGRRSQEQALNVIAAMFGKDAFSLNWSELRYQHTAAIRSRLLEVYKPATVNKFLSAIRGVLKQAWILGQMSAEEYHRATQLKSVNIDTLPAGRDLSRGEIRALLNDCLKDDSNIGVRDGAIIALLAAGGLRRQELVTLELDDYNPETGKLLVKGKRQKDRYIYLDNGAADAMEDWLYIRGDQPGALFLAINKSGAIQYGDKMAAQSIYDMLKKRAESAKIKNFSPHDLRRTLAGDLLDEGVDIVTVSKILGHSNVSTTGRYDRRGEEIKKKAAGTIHIPYRKRF